MKHKGRLGLVFLRIFENIARERFKRRQPRKGHTLLGIGWMSSLDDRNFQLV